MHDHPASTHPDLIVGTSTSDDAGVYRLASGQAMVQSVDFFTPIVDDPYDWGRIAAANALSDIYAMGATPLTALALIGWPRDRIPWDVAAHVTRGGADAMAAAHCTIVGGHSIDDQEPKYGFAVTGVVDPDRVVTNAGAVPGDALVLTKPLGVGIVTTAIKRGICPDALARRAVQQMAELNDRAASSLSVPGVHAATDVTGFGFLGHLLEMLAASGVSAEISAADVPVLEGTVELLEQGCWPGGSDRNLDAVRASLDSDVDETLIRVLADAQTSGGLLIAASDGAELVGALRRAGVGAWHVGSVVPGPGATMLVR